jgi:putative tricarboxylic transport membrane protein
MLDGLVMFGNAVVGYLNPVSLTLAFGATLLGVVAGCMPGLSATLVITLLTTLTLKMQPNQAILVLVCAYNGAIYGGSRTAILLNIPGTAANAAACIDGYQLARQGQAGRAMGIATTGSVVGTLFGLVCLALFTPMLGEVALSFGAFEFFWLALLGVVMSGNVSLPTRSRAGSRAFSACSSPASARKACMPTSASASAMPISPADLGSSRFSSVHSASRKCSR